MSTAPTNEVICRAREICICEMVQQQPSVRNMRVKRSETDANKIGQRDVCHPTKLASGFCCLSVASRCASGPGNRGIAPTAALDLFERVRNGLVWVAFQAKALWQP